MQTKVRVPQLGESITEGILTKWFKKPGEAVRKDEPLLEISTDKIDSEIPSPAAGTLLEIVAAAGETVAVNSIVAVIETETARPVSPAPPAPLAPAEGPVPGPAPRVIPPEMAHPPSAGIRPTALARKIAAAHGIDLSHLQGTGASGRIARRDIVPAAISPKIGEPPAPALRGAVPPVSGNGPVGLTRVGDQERRERREPMSAMRKAIARHMVMSKRTSPHVTTVFEVDFSAVERSTPSSPSTPPFRMACVAMAVVRALKQHPALNSSIDGEDVVYREDIHLGLAVALESGGLIVPVVRNADRLGIQELARALRQIEEAARSKRLTPDDVRGGTFTIMNTGACGGLLTTPIINQPQAAILCIGAVIKRVVVVDDAVAIRPMAYLSLSFDHRSVDGSLADSFMADVKKQLEEWTDAAD